MSQSSQQRPAQQSGKPGYQSARSRGGTSYSGDTGSPASPGRPTSLTTSLQDKQLLRGLRAVAVDPATAIAVSVERAEALFFSFFVPLFILLKEESKQEVSIGFGSGTKAAEAGDSWHVLRLGRSDCLRLGSGQLTTACF